MIIRTVTTHPRVLNVILCGLWRSLLADRQLNLPHFSHLSGKAHPHSIYLQNLQPRQPGLPCMARSHTET